MAKSKSKSKKRHPHKIEISRVHGGFLAKHHFKQESGSMEPNEPEEHVVAGDEQAAGDHVADSFGPEEAQAAGQGSPPAPPAGQMP